MGCCIVGDKNIASMSNAMCGNRFCEQAVGFGARGKRFCSPGHRLEVVVAVVSDDAGIDNVVVVVVVVVVDHDDDDNGKRI